MIVHEYLKLFVFRKKMVTYEYFMDKIQDWEVSLLADSVTSGYREEWEMTRWLVYSIIQPNLKKSLRDKPMKEIIPLPFDEDYYTEEPDIEITQEQVGMLRERAEFIGDMLRSNKSKKTEETHGSKHT